MNSKKKWLETKPTDDVKQRVSYDIPDIWTDVDVQNGGQHETEIVAAEPNRLPSVDAEKYSFRF